MVQPFSILLMLILMVPVLITIRPKVVVDEEYESQESYTIDLDLPTSGKVSTLWLRVHARCTDTYKYGHPFMKNLISSISVNQGGQEALNAARPAFFEADYFYKTGKMPRMGFRQWETAKDIEEYIPILFGEKIDDPHHYIDLSKLNDPKLSIKYDTSMTDMDGNCPWTTDYYPRFTVIADLLGGADLPASKGYHSIRAIETYEPINDQIKNIELKGSRPIRRLYFEPDPKPVVYVMRQSVDTIKLWGENEAYVPFEMKSERFKNLVRLLFGPCEVSYQLEYFGQESYYDWVAEEYDYQSITNETSVVYAIGNYGGSGRGGSCGWFKRTDGSVPPAGTGGRVYCHFIGIAPWSVYPLDMPKMIGLEYLDPQEHKPMYFTLEHTDDAATTCDGPLRVVIEDLVKI